MNISYEYDIFINCANNEIDDINIFTKYLFLSIPSGSIITIYYYLKYMENDQTFRKWISTHTHNILLDV